MMENNSHARYGIIGMYFLDECPEHVLHGCGGIHAIRVYSFYISYGQAFFVPTVPGTASSGDGTGQSILICFGTRAQIRY